MRPYRGLFLTLGTLLVMNAGAGRAQYEGESEDPNYGVPASQVEDDRFENCSDYFEDGYECVPYDLCDRGEIIIDGGGIFDIRSGLSDVRLDPKSSKCPSYLEVCCRHPDFAGQAVVGPSTTTISTTTTTYTTTTTEPPAPLTYATCGRRNVLGIGVRIQNQDDYDGATQFGEWPHMCAVLQKKTVAGMDINLYVCGGSIIAPGVVLTAAHCVREIATRDLKIRCGEWDTQQTIEPLPHQDRDVDYMIMHPLFNNETLSNDFAVLFVDEDFELNAAVNPICLPTQGDYDAFDTEGCFATGWGKDQFGAQGQYQVVLKQVALDMVERSQCQSQLRRTALGRFFRLHQSFACAGGVAGVDTCKGDGGGPLVCPVRNGDGVITNYVQTGIVAWGINCGKDDTPGVYASTADGLCFLDWATKCRLGQDFDYLGASNCGGWLDQVLRRQQNKVDNARERWEGADEIDKEKLSNKLDDLNTGLRRINDLAGFCLDRSVVDESGYGSDSQPLVEDPYVEGSDGGSNQEPLVEDPYVEGSDSGSNQEPLVEDPYVEGSDGGSNQEPLVGDPYVESSEEEVNIGDILDAATGGYGGDDGESSYEEEEEAVDESSLTKEERQMRKEERERKKAERQRQKEERQRQREEGGGDAAYAGGNDETDASSDRKAERQRTKEERERAKAERQAAKEERERNREESGDSSAGAYAGADDDDENASSDRKAERQRNKEERERLKAERERKKAERNREREENAQSGDDAYGGDQTDDGTDRKAERQRTKEERERAKAERQAAKEERERNREENANTGDGAYAGGNNEDIVEQDHSNDNAEDKTTSDLDDIVDELFIKPIGGVSSNNDNNGEGYVNVEEETKPEKIVEPEVELDVSGYARTSAGKS